MWVLGLVASVWSAFGPRYLPAPTVASIQAAYEHETSSGSSLHDKGLTVIEAKCHDNSGGRFLCEITFVSTSDPSERLYFDIVAVARRPGGWELTSGLCKR